MADLFRYAAIVAGVGRALGRSHALFSPAPFHAGKIPLKRTLTTGAGRQKAGMVQENMSDDSFFREVNEEMRQDQARALWDRYGPYALALAVLVVLGTAGFVAYEYWTESRASRSGDAFSQALVLANEGKNDEALGALEQLEAEGYGAYPLLARMRAATVLAAKGDFDGAVESFDEVAADSSVSTASLD